MSGTNISDYAGRGLYYRALDDLFELNCQRGVEVTYTITVQLLEIYNEVGGWAHVCLGRWVNACCSMSGLATGTGTVSSLLACVRACLGRLVLMLCGNWKASPSLVMSPLSTTCALLPCRPSATCWSTMLRLGSSAPFSWSMASAAGPMCLMQSRYAWALGLPGMEQPMDGHSSRALPWSRCISPAFSFLQQPRRSTRPFLDSSLPLQVPVSCTEDVLEVMERGARNRAVAETRMNDRSSRSHQV